MYSKRPLFQRVLGIALLLALTAGCTVNPVTGKRELALLDGQAIAMGEKSYVPAQQMQGGQYTVDDRVGDYVRAVGGKLAATSGVDLDYEFVVLNNSVPNAWAMPGGKIAINRGLLVELRNEAELAAVLGHEIVHAAGRHGAKAMERSVLTQTGLVLGSVAAQGYDYGAAALGAAQVAAGLVNQAYGRNAERESDFYGTRYMAEAGYDPQAAVTLQETFLRLSGNRNQTNWIEGLFASHPPSAERVANNRSLVAELRAEGFTNGRMGADDYRAAMVTLNRDREAYEAYDSGRKALAAKNYDSALKEVNFALDKQSDEPLFHALRGDIRQAQRRYQDAVTNYDRALARDDGLFAYHLSRGLAHVQLGNRAAASTDLSSSIRLLPTSIAYNELGKIAEAEGRMEAAERYYQAGAQSGDNAGLAARSSFYRLAVPREPAKYIATRLAEDQEGRLILMVQNRASVDLTGVRLQLELRLHNGQTVRGAPGVDRLPAGRTARVALGRVAADVQSGNAYAVRAQVAN